MTYFKGDKVNYTGTKFSELKNKLGEVVCRVGSSMDSYVIDFGENSYVMGVDCFKKQFVSPKFEKLPDAE